MDKISISLISVIIAAILVQGASAIEIDILEMKISEGGDTEVNFEYSLSFLEKIAVFTKIADPAEELRKVIGEKTDREVEVIEVKSDKASFFIPGFITPKSSPEGTIYTTPAMDFSKGEEILRGYWFAPMITIDLSPAVTTIQFPDNYIETFTDSISIPPVTHTV